MPGRRRREPEGPTPSALAAHQLRRPLAAARQYLDLLGADPTGAWTDERRAWLDRASARLDEALALVEDWLALGRLEAGLLGRSDATTDLDEVLGEVAEDLRDAGAAAGLVVEIALPAPGLRVRGDRAAVLTAFAHLADNAVKYNRPGGRVVLRARAEPDRIAFEVEDTGVGIPAPDLARVFDPFVRVHAERLPHVPGTGLGLAICARIAAGLGGSVEASSVDGVGSTFRMVLPRI